MFGMNVLRKDSIVENKREVSDLDAQQLSMLNVFRHEFVAKFISMASI